MVFFAMRLLFDSVSVIFHLYIKKSIFVLVNRGVKSTSTFKDEFLSFNRLYKSETKRQCSIFRVRNVFCILERQPFLPLRFYVF
jgi:hypothetical protein